ncbi:hypothetical protein CAI21_09730 [Alkalilimnicola ehrlichii]|uniref:Glycosyl transferase family 28 C-terminal domain-containing protein n=2 Tax=Alkalilimnicola ehrlichii TaxID=351052 RepID=A0A3E0WXV9_9GAMM|nr:glycosyltransferase [Alkalilimnicola ehrlichii]RFA29341.1 hypothetical protein CAI21_09730 [Alkalilimnicola ehrlichii]RFA36856.1 hypothetical protein CAL65_10065 [Alkalilimnicola ehrlichii]
MIFVTVGTQLPFERLVQAVDNWAARHPGEDVFIQLGQTTYAPTHCRSVAYTPQAEWERLFQQAERVVSHAGMGTILKSLDYGKPLLMMPRLAVYREHRNDHQVATAKQFGHFGNIRVVNDEQALGEALAEPLHRFAATDTPEGKAFSTLLNELKQFVQNHS